MISIFRAVSHITFTDSHIKETAELRQSIKTINTLIYRLVESGKATANQKKISLLLLPTVNLTSWHPSTP